MKNKITLALLIWATILNGSVSIVYLNNGDHLQSFFSCLISLGCSFVLVANNK